MNIEDTLELKIDDSGQFILMSQKTKKISLEALLSGITQDNIHEKINLDSPIGKELI